jgi:PD-(D/E)XK nuclease superfamily protein
MSVLIGDLMAAADERYEPGGRKKKPKRGGGKKKEAESCCGSCGAPIPRVDQGRPSRKGRGEWDIAGEIQRESLRPLSLRKQKWMPPKRMGELSELDFLRKTMGMGMIVSKPWGDSYRYDFVCDTGGRRRLWRVQVRSTDERFGARGYAVHASVYVGKKMVGLTEKDIDVIVAYIVSRDIWYVVPVKAFVPRKNLWFYPDGSKKGAMFEKYREAWWVMTGKKEGKSRQADGRGRKRK